MCLKHNMCLDFECIGLSSVHTVNRTKQRRIFKIGQQSFMPWTRPGHIMGTMCSSDLWNRIEHCWHIVNRSYSACTHVITPDIHVWKDNIVKQVMVCFAAEPARSASSTAHKLDPCSSTRSTIPIHWLAVANHLPVLQLLRTIWSQPSFYIKLGRRWHDFDYQPGPWQQVDQIRFYSESNDRSRQFNDF